jgi:hypothetical protein
MKKERQKEIHGIGLCFHLTNERKGKLVYGIREISAELMKDLLEMDAH